MKLIKLAAIVMSLSAFGLAQRCDSINATFSGGWKPGATAPRDGTIVETMETYGVAPWYARVKWLKKGQTYPSTITTVSPDGKRKTEPYIATESAGRWMNVDNPQQGPSDDECLFWRATKQTGKTYIDPTRGAQNTTAYWCASMHRPYDAKTESCK